MGVDFFNCDAQGCGETICDAGPFFRCENCYNALCDDCAKQFKAGKYSDLPLDQEIDGDIRNCPFCKVDEVSDDNLFEFALTNLGVSKLELIQRYKEFYK